MSESFILTAIVYVATQILNAAIKDSIYLRIKYFFFPKDSFIIRLEKIINETIDDFEKKYPYNIYESQFPFYHSKTLLEELLMFRLFNEKISPLKKEMFLGNPNIKIPTQSELTEFLDLFIKKVNQDKDLKHLYIKENFQEEIFNISEKLNLLDDKTDDILNILMNYDNNTSEWIEKFEKDIKEFKPKAALENLSFIEEKIRFKGNTPNMIKAKIKSLNGVCKKELWETEEGNKDIIEAYLLDPASLDIQERATIAYFEMNEEETALKIAKEIIDKNPYNETASALLCMKEKNLTESLKKLSDYVTRKNDFKTTLASLLLFKRRFSEVESIFGDEIKKYKLPNIITYQNKNYHSLIIISLLERHYQNNLSINLNSKISNVNSDEINLIHDIASLFVTAYTNTEKFYQLHYFIFVKAHSRYLISMEVKYVLEMYNSYLNIKDSERQLLTFTMMSCLCQTGNFDKAIEIINLLENKTEETLFVESFAYLKLGNLNLAIDSFYKYLKSLKEINGINFLSILAHSEVLFQDTNSYESFTKEISTFNNINKVHHTIFKVFLNIKQKNNKQDILKILDNDFSTDEVENHKIVFALFYNLLGEHKKSNSLLKSLINEKKESLELKLYIDNLYYGKLDTTELLSMLRNWRKNEFSNIENFYKWEIELLSSIPDWPEVETVSRKAFNAFPENSYFSYCLIHSLYKLHKEDDVKEILNKNLTDLKFDQNEIFRIAGIAARQKEKKISLDLVFPLANDFSNKVAREQFFYLMSILHKDKNEIAHYDEVIDGLFVRVNIDGKEQIIEVNESSRNNDPRAKQLLNKKVGDSIVLNKPFSDEKLLGKVEAIYDKYQKLFYEILEEVNNSQASGLNIQSVKFEGNDPELLKKNLIEQFGKIGQYENERRLDEMNEYDKRKKSFSEITRSVFNDKPIDSYHFLASNSSNGFHIQQLKAYPEILLTDEINFVLDFTSLFLFYQIDKEKGIKFQKKFYISSYILEYLEEELYLTEIEGDKKLTLSITMTDIIPYFYPENYKTERIKYLKDLISWIRENTITRPVIEKIEIMNQVRTQHPKWDDFYEGLMDTAFLADQPNSILITDDSFYFSLFHNNGKVISSEYFLKRFFPQEMLDTITPFILLRNYIGTSIGYNDLVKAFEESYGTNYSNYDKCLKNLPYNSKANPASVFEYVKFIKEIYMKPSIPIFLKKEISRNVWAMNLKGFILTRDFINWLNDLINTEFYFLQNYIENVREDLNDAIQTIVKKI